MSQQAAVLAQQQLFHGAPRWSALEDETLRNFVAATGQALASAIKKAGLLTGRNRSAVNKRMLVLGLIANPKANRPWKTGEIRLLRLLSLVRKMGANAIVKSKLLLGRTLPAVKNQMQRLGLRSTDPSRQKRVALRLSKPQRDELLQYLLGEGRKACSREMAEKFSVNQGIVNRLRKKHGLTLSYKDSHNSARVREAVLRHLPLLQQGRQRHWQTFWERRRQAMLKLQWKKKTAGSEDKLNTCRKCRFTWFATPEFFYQGKLLVSGLPSLHGYCRACGLPWKRGKAKGKKAGETSSSRRSA